VSTEFASALAGQVPQLEGTSGPSPSFRAEQSRSDADRQRLAEAALQFEAMFLLQMLKQMRQSMLPEEETESGLGAETMFDTVDAELARHLAGNRNGLAALLTASMTAAAGLPVTRASESAPGATPVAVPPQRSGSGPETPATITSPFGWRRDPFTGASRFHSGVDIKAAYGSDVTSAAAGRVVSSGDQRGYGQTVVVEHGPGLRTRYAHLSHIAVREGDIVSSGDLLGRVGQSGRATGPHLHFEVLENGRPVDPGAGSAHFSSRLKDFGAGADYTTGRAGVGTGSAGADE
jgi:murein DD-endopeptidase MepM/ murein hydrolase activator NlpD